MDPIERAFAQLKALMHQESARTLNALWRRIGTFLDAFSRTECANFFRHAGYQRSM